MKGKKSKEILEGDEDFPCWQNLSDSIIQIC